MPKRPIVPHLCPSYSDSFGGVLDYRNVIFGGNFHYLVHPGRHAVEMHYDDCFRLVRREFYAFLDGGAQERRVHIPCHRFAVDEHRASTEIYNRIGRSREGHRLTYYFISFVDSDNCKRKMYGRRSGAECHDIVFAEIFVEQFLETIDIRP